MISGILAISFILQSIFSNFVCVTGSYFTPLFSLCALILVYPYFKDKNKFLFVCFLYGIFYDILFSHLLFMNAFLFFLLGIMITILNHLWNNHIFNVILFTVVVISLYRTIYYFLLSIIEKIEWTSLSCIKIVAESLLMNVFYVVIAFYITDFISKKYKIYKID